MAHIIFLNYYCVDPAATAPSLFFIGKSGTPLEIITTAPSLNDFDSKLTAILEKHGVKQQSSGKWVKVANFTDNYHHN